MSSVPTDLVSPPTQLTEKRVHVLPRLLLVILPYDYYCLLLLTGLTAYALATQLKRDSVLALDFAPPSISDSGQTTTAASDSSTSKTQKHTQSTAAAPRTFSGRGIEESRMLKAELKARGLSTKGSKAELRARLAEAGGHVPV